MPVSFRVYRVRVVRNDAVGESVGFDRCLRDALAAGLGLMLCSAQYGGWKRLGLSVERSKLNMSTKINSKPRNSIRLPEQRWDQARECYVRGEGSLTVLASRFSISVATVEARCRREGWVKLRNQRRRQSLTELVGGSPTNNAPIPIKDAEWWSDRDKEHLVQNLDVCGSLRREIEAKIGGASATELERLAIAQRAIIESERELLELKPRSPKQNVPSLRPSGKKTWEDWEAEVLELNPHLKTGEPPPMSESDDSLE